MIDVFLAVESVMRWMLILCAALSISACSARRSGFRKATIFSPPVFERTVEVVDSSTGAPVPGARLQVCVSRDELWMIDDSAPSDGCPADEFPDLVASAGEDGKATLRIRSRRSRIVASTEDGREGYDFALREGPIEIGRRPVVRLSASAEGNVIPVDRVEVEAQPAYGAQGEVSIDSVTLRTRSPVTFELRRGATVGVTLHLATDSISTPSGFSSEAFMVRRVKKGFLVGHALIRAAESTESTQQLLSFVCLARPIEVRPIVVDEGGRGSLRFDAPLASGVYVVVVKVLGMVAAPQLLTVAEGETRNVTFTLPEPEAGRILGTVLTPEGRWLSGGLVEILLPDIVRSTAAAAWVDSRGKFEFPSVTPGPYGFRFIGTEYDGPGIDLVVPGRSRSKPDRDRIVAVP